MRDYERMRVVTWNMGMARVSRGNPGLHDQAWHYLLGLGPDLAFVQEALPPSWVRATGTLVHGPFSTWGSALFSARYPLERVRPPAGSNLLAFGSYLALAVATLPDGTDALISSVHARAGTATDAQLGPFQTAMIKRPSARSALANDAIFAGLAEMTGQRFIVAGDWNTGREQGSEARDRIGTEFFDRASEREWHDCSFEHGDGRELKTWFGKGDIVQDDHVFADASLAASVRSVWVADEAAECLALSDHAPLIVDLEVPPISMTSLGEATGPDPEPIA
jgi:endonuclease/exonuclease/phosphatase family protein